MGAVAANGARGRRWRVGGIVGGVMRSHPRRTAPKVADGRVQFKSNWEAHRADYTRRVQKEIAIDRRPAGPGYRHLITVAQLRDFLPLLPEWEGLALGLDAIVLDGGSSSTLGWHMHGVVAINAWDKRLWWSELSPEFAEEHDEVLDLLGVERVKVGRRTEVRWTEPQARAFQLLDVLVHELGHHRDRVTTRSFARPARGEGYAEGYAQHTLKLVLPEYARRFGI